MIKYILLPIYVRVSCLAWTTAAWVGAALETLIWKNLSIGLGRYVGFLNEWALREMVVVILVLKIRGLGGNIGSLNDGSLTVVIGLGLFHLKLILFIIIKFNSKGNIFLFI